MLLVILFISVGILTRFVPHLPNFSPLAAVALFAGLYSKKKYTVLALIALYALTDLILGMHNTVLFTWGSIALIYFFGTYLRKNKSIGRTFSYTIFSAITFFIVTNFGVWLMGWYPRTAGGLGQCFINALPFFRMSLISNLVYGAAFYSVCEYWFAKNKVLQESV
jgi:Family of unknown function (DUF6580)